MVGDSRHDSQSVGEESKVGSEPGSLCLWQSRVLTFRGRFYQTVSLNADIKTLFHHVFELRGIMLVVAQVEEKTVHFLEGWGFNQQPSFMDF